MQLKTCTVCLVDKSTDEFHKTKAAKDGLAYRCKSCTKAYTDAYYRLNSEKVKATVNKYRKENPEKKKLQNRIHFEKRRHRQYEYNSNREAAKLKATPCWANQEAIEQFYLIANFLTVELEIAFHVDHIVPLRGKTVCGLHCEHNMAISLGSWNIAKGNRFWPDMPE